MNAASSSASWGIKELKPKLAAVLVSLLMIDAVLVVLHLLVPILAGRSLRFFNLNAEANLPTWWSSVQLALAGLLFALIAIHLRRMGPGSWILGLLAALLLTLSLDEFAQFHERIGFIVDGETRRETIFWGTGNWFLFLGIPTILVVFLTLRALKQKLRAVPSSRASVTAGFVLLFAGALGAEVLSNFVTRGSIAAELQVALEEGLEMAGGSVLLWSALVFLVFHPSLAGVAELVKRSTPTRCEKTRPQSHP
jgi:hypothetical protein